MTKDEPAVWALRPSMPLLTALLTEHEEGPSAYLVRGLGGADGETRTHGLPLTRRLLCH